jgi:hypothetical protein
VCKCTRDVAKRYCGGPGCEDPTLDKERSPCDAIPNADCDARPGCKLGDGSWCPAYPAAHRGRRA